ncbi:cytochrome c maturation protein CcmE [bacterium]|nr:cytochrome c maturation protein CcmE [bacterium]
MNRKRKFLLGSAILVAAIGTLVWTAVRETSAYFMTVDEWAVDPGAHADASLRLAGRVTQGSVQWDPKTLDLAFVLMPIPKGQGGSHEGRRAGETLPIATAEARLPVSYNGILPDMFADGRDVIVEGRVVDGVFHAKSLLTTCPSKYEADKQAPAQEAGGNGSPA